MQYLELVHFTCFRAVIVQQSSPKFDALLPSEFISFRNILDAKYLYCAVAQSQMLLLRLCFLDYCESVFSTPYSSVVFARVFRSRFRSLLLEIIEILGFNCSHCSRPSLQHIRCLNNRAFRAGPLFLTFQWRHRPACPVSTLKLSSFRIFLSANLTLGVVVQDVLTLASIDHLTTSISASFHANVFRLHCQICVAFHAIATLASATFRIGESVTFAGYGSCCLIFFSFSFFVICGDMGSVVLVVCCVLGDVACLSMWRCSSHCWMIL